MTLTIEQQTELDSILAKRQENQISSTQTAVTLAEPGVRPKPTEIAAPMPAEPSPLSEKETIEIVKQWVAEDAEFELSERRTFEEMVEALQDVGEGRTTKVSASQFEQIIRTYAPNAPRRNETPSKDDPSHSYPAELTPVIKSGVATYEDGFWLLKRCRTCGLFKNECCGTVELVTAVRDDGKT